MLFKCNEEEKSATVHQTGVKSVFHAMLHPPSDPLSILTPASHLGSTNILLLEFSMWAMLGLGSLSLTGMLCLPLCKHRFPLLQTSLLCHPYLSVIPQSSFLDHQQLLSWGEVPMKGGSFFFTPCPRGYCCQDFYHTGSYGPIYVYNFQNYDSTRKAFLFRFCSSELCTWYIRWVVKGRRSEVSEALRTNTESSAAMCKIQCQGYYVI